MIHKIFTVFDCKAEAYLPPFLLHAKGQAIRAFTDMANDPNHVFNKHPEDYTLFELGEFDDGSAIITIHPSPQSMGVALEFVAERTHDDLRLVDLKGGVS